MGIGLALKVGGEALTQVANKAVKPMCQTTTLKSIGLKMEPLIGDSICITNPIRAINSLLRNNYGIKSEITNPEIGQRIITTVEDFVKTNKNNNIFRNLILRQGAVDNGIASVVANPKSNEFILTFNENFDWENLETITKQMYNKGQIPSDNPACLLYKEFGRFLNFQYNPYAYTYSMGRNFVDDSALKVLRISNSTNVSEFNANYIAGRMSGRNYPKFLKTLFEESSGNLNLKFPKADNLPIVQGSIHHFKSTQDSAKYLLEKYGITAEFVNTEQANLFAGAVDDLVKLTGKPHIFRGLKTRIAPEKYDNMSTKMTLFSDYATGEAELWINPACDWNNYKKGCLKNYQAGHNPSANPKDTYIHELVHYLDFKGNPVEYVKTNNAFNNGQIYFNDYGKSITAKVSSYATKNDAEFHAEYVAGRLNGIMYPEATNKEFASTWHGTILNFDDLQ